MNKIVRTPKSWLAYLLLCLFVYCLNAAGPVTNYLRTELDLSYSLSSIHTSAFALGLVLVGLFGGLFLHRLSHWRAMAVGAIGMGGGGLLLCLAKTPALTILGLFLMGLIGTLILAVYPAILNEEMGQGSSVGISEANTLASVFASLAPLAIGFFAGMTLTWRPAILIVTLACTVLGIWLLLKEKDRAEADRSASVLPPASGKLPLLFWMFWVALVISISIEFCTIYWSGDFIKQSLAISQARATQAVSIFLVGMVIGRFIGGKLMLKVSSRKILSAAIVLGATGFVAFWGSRTAWLTLAGLGLMGLGVANLYPVILSMAVSSAGDLKALAGTRCTLASGTAILLLPFILGALADVTGITRAFLLVAVLFGLLVGVLFIISSHKKKSGRQA